MLDRATAALGKDNPAVKILSDQYLAAKEAQADNRTLEAQLQSATDRVRNHTEAIDGLDQEIGEYKRQIDKIQAKIDKAQLEKDHQTQLLEAATKTKDDVLGKFGTKAAGEVDADPFSQCLKYIGMAVPRRMTPALQKQFNEMQTNLTMIAAEIQRLSGEHDGEQTAAAAAASSDAPPTGTATPNAKVRKAPSEQGDADMQEQQPQMPTKFRKAMTTSLASIDPIEDGDSQAERPPREQCS